MDFQKLWLELIALKGRIPVSLAEPLLLFTLLFAGFGAFIAWRWFDKDLAALRRRGRFRAPQNLQFAFANIFVWRG